MDGDGAGSESESDRTAIQPGEVNPMNPGREEPQLLPGILSTGQREEGEWYG
jgi:hypothetical protein